jgi:spoIIIJ-associated protein
MKEYTNKTVEDCLNDAAADTGVEASHLVYRVVEEKSGLLHKKATIEVYDISDAEEYAKKYLHDSIALMGIEVTAESRIEDDIIRITLDSERNPVLIGKQGRTLQALNELTKLAVSNKFHHRFRVLLDVGGYKEDKYSRITYIARKTADEVVKTHIDVKLDPMTPDERRIVHNVLNGMEHIKTESEGVGEDRAVVVKYVD